MANKEKKKASRTGPGWQHCYQTKGHATLEAQIQELREALIHGSGSAAHARVKRKVRPVGTVLVNDAGSGAA